MQVLKRSALLAGLVVLAAVGALLLVSRAPDRPRATAAPARDLGTGATADLSQAVPDLLGTVPLEGRLVDDKGAPVAGGWVTVTERAFSPLPAIARSDGEGRFSAAVVSGRHLVEARAPGFLPAAPRTVEVPGPPVEIALSRGATVEGRVVDESDKPIAGARIEVSGEGPEGAPIAMSGVGAPSSTVAARWRPSGELGILEGPVPYPPPRPLADSAFAASFFSDREGKFRITGLPSGRVVIAAWHPDFARGSSPVVEARVGQAATVQVVLPRGALQKGRVTDERGFPIAGVEVATSDGRVALTDGRGEFVLKHLLRGTTLTARRSGYLPSTRGTGDEEIEIKLREAAGRLEGAVVDERGFPVANARVEVTGGPARPALSDGRGRFRIDGLGSGPYRVRVTHADFTPTEVAGIAAGDEAQLQLLPGAGISLEVRDARTGRVPPGVAVELILDGRSQAMSQKRGRFEATGLRAGAARVQASAPGYVPAHKDVELPAGERPREITLRDLVIELQRGGVVTGTLLSSEGDPVAGALVSAGHARARTDERGNFRLEGVAPGRARVEAVERQKRAIEDVDVRENDESRVDLRLR